MEKQTFTLENNPVIEENPFGKDIPNSKRYYVTGFISGGRIPSRSYTLKDFFKSPEAIACYREIEREFPKYCESARRI